MSSNAVDNSFTSLLYHFTDNNNKVPIYPYITAITGHRRFNKNVPQKKSGQEEPSGQEEQSDKSKEIPTFSEEEIKDAFKSQLRPMAELWHKSCGQANAPFILLTGMADGSDQLAAEAALELDPELNIKIVAVLPMPEQLFLSTVEDKDRYNELMQKVSFKFALPLTIDNENHESEMWGDSDEAESRRQDQYARLGLFLAVHSHVLFAFWDGVPSTQLKGGTADTVFLKLNGISEIQDTKNQESKNQDSDNSNQGDFTNCTIGPGDLLTFSSVGPVIHLLIPRDNDDNRAFALDNSQDMSSIPVLFWTRDKKRQLENTLKKQKEEKEQAVSDANPEADEAKHLLEQQYSQWFNKCDSLVSISKLDFRKDLINSDLRCKTAIADQKEIKEVLTKIGALNLFSVNQFNRSPFFDRFRPEEFKYDSFFEKCRTESYNWLFDVSDNQDSQSSQNASNSEVSFPEVLGELRPWEDSNTRILVEHYIVADRMALKYQHYSDIISKRYLSFFKYLSYVIGVLATFWSIRIYGWAKEPGSLFHFVWTFFGTEDQFACRCLPVSALLFILLSCILLLIYIVAKYLKYHYRYHRFRAVAEALRVQIFWRIAGIPDCVSGYYRSHQIPETEWIRAAVNGLDVFLNPPVNSDFSASREERINFVKNVWVSGQRDYFSKTINKKKNEQKGPAAFWAHPYMKWFFAVLFFYLQLKGDISKFAFSVLHNIVVGAIHVSVLVLNCLNVSLPPEESIVNFVYPPTLLQPNWAIGIFVIIGIIVSYFTGKVVYYTMQLKFKRAKIEEKRFEQILFPFDRASLLLNVIHFDNEQKTIKTQQTILRQLGSEAVSENVNWLLTVGEQDLSLPR